MKQLMTERLLLNELRDNDAAAIFALRSNPVVNRFLDRLPQEKPEEALIFINKIKQGYEKGDCYYWAIRSKDSDQLIGTICLWNFSADGKTAELGYELHPEQQGKGLMTEAIGAVLSFGSSILGLTNVEAYTHKDNLDSAKLLLKHGFKPNRDRKDPDNANIDIYILNPATLQ